MQIKIKVTKEILKKSFMCKAPGSVDVDGNWYPVSTSCAFALAFRDLFPEASVGYSTIYPFALKLPEGEPYPSELEIPVPSDMHAFICRFDELAPFPEKRLKLPEQTFEVSINDAVIQRIGIEEVETILSNSLTLEKA